MERIDLDVLVVGAGPAGLRAAIEAHDRGAEVAVASKSLPGKSNATNAHVGLAAAVGAGDSWERHFRDTYRKGGGLCDWRAAEILAKEAPRAVEELEGWGCLFDRSWGGSISQRPVPGHSRDRVCEFGDVPGREVTRTLQHQAMWRDVELLDEVVFQDLVVDGGRVVGAVGLDMRGGRCVAVSCGSVVLATGGLGRVFGVTTNSREATGDGFAMAFRAGAELRDMEMVVFNPLGLLESDSGRGELLPGSALDLGRLVNGAGERFLDGRFGDVARAIHAEILSGRGTGSGGVYLDLTNRSFEELREGAPGLLEKLERVGVNPSVERVEVAPTAHYLVGGVSFDPETCGTGGVPGLFVAGEAAGGVNGADWLATNSLPETLVFGRRAGEAAAEERGSAGLPDLGGVRERLMGPLDGGEGPDPEMLSSRLGRTVWRGLGPVREERGMRTALRRVTEVRELASTVSVEGSTGYNLSLLEAMSLRNMALVAEVITRSALAREESRGAHFRRDHPETDEECRASVRCGRADGVMDVSMEEVEDPPERLAEVL